MASVLRLASEDLNEAPATIEAEVASPGFCPGKCFTGRGDWRTFVPYDLRGIWGTLSEETRIALYFACAKVAQNALSY
jgi:hypothetical protein